MNDNQITIKVTAKDQASAVLKGIGSVAHAVVQPFKLLTGAVGGLYSAMTSLPGIIAQVGAGLAFKSAVDAASNLEQLTISFETMLGSAEQAKDLLRDITQAAKATPFELPELEKASKQLLAYGFNAKEVVPTIKMLGDVAAGVGADVGDLAYLFGTLRTQGRAFTVDIRQFAGRGIPIMEQLAKQFRVSTEELSVLIEEGKVGFPDVEKAFRAMTGEGGRFANLMEKQSQSLAGIRSNIKDTLGLMARDLLMSTGLFDQIKAGAQRFLDFLNNNSVQITEFVKILVENLGTAVTLVRAFVAPWFTLGTEVLGKILEQTGGIGGALQSISNFMRPITDSFSVLAELFRTHIAEFVRGIMPAFRAVLEKVGPFVRELVQLFANLATAILPVLGPLLTDAFNMALRALKPVLDVVTELLRIINEALKALGQLLEADRQAKQATEQRLSLDQRASDRVSKFKAANPALAGQVSNLQDIANLQRSGVKINAFAKGGDFVTKGRQLIMVGDNPGGQEHVQVTPLSSPNINGAKGTNVNLTINNYGNALNESMLLAKAAFLINGA